MPRIIRHEGMRMPSERAGVFIEPSGPVITYTLSPEEIAAKYGPPVSRTNPPGYVPGGRPAEAVEGSKEETTVGRQTSFDLDWLRAMVDRGLSSEQIAQEYAKEFGLQISRSTVDRARKKWLEGQGGSDVEQETKPERLEDSGRKGESQPAAPYFALGVSRVRLDSLTAMIPALLELLGEGAAIEFDGQAMVVRGA